MKKLIPLFIVLAFTANVSAQFRVNAQGQAGIGTTTPQNKLDVIGNARVAGNIYLVNASGFLGTSADFPLIFKVNNILAGNTGNLDDSNVIFGYGSFIQALADDSYLNTAIGYEALRSHSIGSANTALGVQALYDNRTGRENVANGYQALYTNQDGNENTAIGALALYNNYSGSRNTAVGYYAGAIGYLNNTIAIGYNADVYANNLNNTIAIGYNAKADADNQVRLGNYMVTSAGGAVSWSTVSDGRAKRNIAANIPGLKFINRLQPVSYNLDLKAIDELTKSDDPKINAHRDSLQKAMSPEERKITEEARANKESKVYSGFIAQDVEKAAKETGYDFSGVDAPENGKGPYGLRYAEFVVPLVKAVQELSKQNDTKDIAIANLQEQNNSLQKQINELAGKANAPEAIKSAVPAGLPETATGSSTLEQNIPNPFNQNTVIKYYLPKTVTAAQLCIYDLNGKQLKQIPLSGRGEGSQTISGSEFSAGIYLYALIADGQEVDVKRMILTE